YTGAEDQLPDPSLESLPEEYGGGVGETPAYPGTCYVVLKDLECAGGRVPQFRWEVASDAEEESLPVANAGFETTKATLDYDSTCAHFNYTPYGVGYSEANETTLTGQTFNYGILRDNLSVAIESTVTFQSEE